MFKILWIFMLLWVYGDVDFKVNLAIVNLQLNFLAHAFSHDVSYLFFSIKNDQSFEAKQR